MEPVAPQAPALELVETFPIETDLDHAELPEAFDVWQEMIDGATSTLEFAEFYASNAPESRLEVIIEAVEVAAARGVRVRFLAEEKFYATYPETLDRLATRPGIEVRRYDLTALTGGVLHAKYFIVDGREAYLGSQNFDWRALTHIQELGARIRGAPLVRALADIFETDWALAGGAERTHRATPPADGYGFPALIAADGDTLRVTPVFSPADLLPDPSLWDLPRIIEIIDGAERTLGVQLLSYRTVGRDGSYFEDLESALRRAAARGVEVRLLLSHWCKRSGTIEGLQSLEAVPGIEVRLVTIPPWSGGFIPYARVIHAKYMVADGERAWIGTSNWDRDYFHASRNVGLVVEGRRVGAILERFFIGGWNGPHTEPVDACATYEEPRVGR